MELGAAALPKAGSKEHMWETMKLSFNSSPEDMKALKSHEYDTGSWKIQPFSGIQRKIEREENDGTKENIGSIFSCSGVTKKAAEAVASVADADLYEIKPEIPYTSADLDWTDPKSRSSIEMKDPSSRPAIAEKAAGMDGYETIFVGFPIWWYVAPTIINTFLETYDFSGKRIILFATSGGSGFGKTAAALKKSLSPDAALVEGKLLNTGLSPADLRAWCQSLAL